MLEKRNNRKEKLIEDYDVNKLEHFYGTKFAKKMGD